MLSKEQKDAVIEEMQRDERYRKVEMGILGLSQYKPTEEDLVFLIKEHKDLTAEIERLKAELKSAYDEMGTPDYH